jgi:hypothetical protein
MAALPHLDGARSAPFEIGLEIDVIAAPIWAGTHQPNRLWHRSEVSLQPWWLNPRTTVAADGATTRDLAGANQKDVHRHNIHLLQR